MTVKNLNVMRTVLLVLMFALLAVSAILYVLKGRFDFSSIGAAAGCLFFYLITKTKET